jgi:MFS family permease
MPREKEGILEKRFQPLKAWTVAIVITLAQVAFAINMFKVPAAMVQISAAFGLDAVGSGNLMNAVGIASFALSIPSGMVMQRFGPRRLFIILFVINILGTALGALSITLAPSYPILIASRVIEGFAYGLLGTTATAFVSAWFPIQRRGLPNAISTLYVSFGQLIILLAGTFIVPQANLQAPTFDFVNVWYLALGSLVLMFIVGLVFLRMPKPEDSFLVGHDEKTVNTVEKTGLFEGFKAPSVWLLFSLFLSFGVITTAFGIYYPEYLQNALGLPYVQANQLTSICTVALMVSGFIGGVVLRRVPPRKRSWYLLAVSLPLPLLGAWMFNLPATEMALPFLIVYGLVTQLFPGVVLTMAPEASHSYRTLGITMGVLMLGMNAAGLLGVIITSIFIVNGGYDSIIFSNTLFGFAGLASAIALLFTMRRRWKQIDATGEEIP